MTHIIRHTSANGRVELPQGCLDVTPGPKRIVIAYTSSILGWEISEMAITMRVERLGKVSEYVKTYGRVDVSRIPAWALSAARSVAPR